MGNSNVNVQHLPTPLGRPVDTNTIVVGGDEVHRQRITISDSTDADSHSRVLSSDPSNSDFGQVVRPILDATTVTNIGIIAATAEGSPGASDDGILYGKVSIAPTATSLVHSVVLAVDRKFLGISVNGDADALFVAKINSVEIMSSKINRTNPQDTIIAPVGKPVASGSTVELFVTNNGESTQEFRGNLFFG